MVLGCGCRGEGCTEDGDVGLEMPLASGRSFWPILPRFFFGLDAEVGWLGRRLCAARQAVSHLHLRCCLSITSFSSSLVGSGLPAS